jgi:hypothetical protein
MGAVTKDAKDIAQGFITRYNDERKEDGDHNGWLDSAYGRVQASHVFGLLAIRDMRKNVLRQTVVNSTPRDHAEFRVRNTLFDLYPNGAASDLKVILYLKRSPCTVCTPHISSEFHQIYHRWANDNFVYFSITFHNYYTTGENCWDSPMSAQTAYNQINTNSDWVQDITTRKEKRLLTIRHYSATKNGALHQRIESRDM